MFLVTRFTYTRKFLLLQIEVVYNEWNVINIKYSLLDIDECEDRIDDCDTNSDCKNTEGSFECTCAEGYTGDGRKCEGRKCLVCRLFKVYFNLVLFLIKNVINILQHIVYPISNMYNLKSNWIFEFQSSKGHITTLLFYDCLYFTCFNITTLLLLQNKIVHGREQNSLDIHIAFRCYSVLKYI